MAMGHKPEETTARHKATAEPPPDHPPHITISITPPTPHHPKLPHRVSLDPHRSQPQTVMTASLSLQSSTSCPSPWTCEVDSFLNFFGSYWAELVGGELGFMPSWFTFQSSKCGER
ncbi:hypothetical protein M0R45_004288 [Rubus argutus]|uniref:Uncharacterized protein n=1 Tax=Rubus argutus TaxID=59490 RepID=A0AAW1YJA8_RUBAR